VNEFFPTHTHRLNYLNADADKDVAIVCGSMVFTSRLRETKDATRVILTPKIGENVILKVSKFAYKANEAC
jgi:hypothetical protein